MFFSLRSEAIRLITKTGYKIILYLLINYFIDKYFGLDSWSWNDYLTVVLIGIEAVVSTIKRIKNERR
jgi:amino acid permease